MGPWTEQVEYAPIEKLQRGVYGLRGLESDIFSLGCVFLEMTTVIMGASLQEMWKKIFPTQTLVLDSKRTGKAQHEEPKDSYCESLDEIKVWISYLKECRNAKLVAGETGQPPTILHDNLERYSSFSHAEHEYGKAIWRLNWRKRGSMQAASSVCFKSDTLQAQI